MRGEGRGGGSDTLEHTLQSLCSLLPVMLELLGRPQQLLDVLGHLFSFQDDVLSAGQGGVWFSCLPTSSLLGLPPTVLLAAAARAAVTVDHRHTVATASQLPHTKCVRVTQRHTEFKHQC